jgi:glucose-6-phosphate isomerase
MVSTTFDKNPEVLLLKKHYEETISKTSLSVLLQDESRNEKLRFKVQENLILDCTHAKIDSVGVAHLEKIAANVSLTDKIAAMFRGDVINQTEKRQVWHCKLRDYSGDDSTSKAVKGVLD